jgi:hypothetical protein
MQKLTMHKMFKTANQSTQKTIRKRIVFFAGLLHEGGSVQAPTDGEIEPHREAACRPLKKQLFPA